MANVGKIVGGIINAIQQNNRPIVFDIRSSTTLARELPTEEVS
jgi:hypothetical protein